jgi:hypothetical protein
VNGNNVALINAGNQSTNGLYAYGQPFWGNCCTRNYDAIYDIQAPYLAGQHKKLKLTTNQKKHLSLNY